MTAPAPTVVYDNTTNDNRNTVATGPDGASGSEVTLSGSARVVTDFLFGYLVDNDATATVKFWANDGPKGAPGTCLYSSGKIDVPASNDNGAVQTLSSLSVEVPDTFTWTVRSQTVNLIGYGPATVGSFGPAWYSGPVRNEHEQVIGIWWYKDNPYKGGFESRILARTLPPRPDWSEQIVGQILEGVINDGGGLVLVGGHLVRVPPREPVEAILAALPAQLAQRLKPLLAAPPHGDLPQLALRQQLTHAINQYQEQARG